MDDEVTALQEITLGQLFIYHKINKQVDANGSIKESTMLMIIMIVTRRDWWQRYITNKLVQISLKTIYL